MIKAFAYFLNPKIMEKDVCPTTEMIAGTSAEFAGIEEQIEKFKKLNEEVSELISKGRSLIQRSKDLIADMENH